MFTVCTLHQQQSGQVNRANRACWLIEANKQRTEQNKELYRRRQTFVEHPYGIIKRHPIAIGWAFYYIMTKKSIKHASADVGLIFTVFNLRRIFNLIDKNILKKHLGACLFFIACKQAF